MIDKLLEYQNIDAGLKEIENSLRQSEEFKKYAQAVKFLKTVADSKAQIESKAASLLGAMNTLQAKLEKLNEEKAEFTDLDGVEDENTINFLKKKSNELSKQFAALEGEITKLSQEMTDLTAQYKKLIVAGEPLNKKDQRKLEDANNVTTNNIIEGATTPLPQENQYENWSE